MEKHLELLNYLPHDWQLRPIAGGIRLTAPSRKDANDFLDKRLNPLVATSSSINGAIEISWDGCSRPFRVNRKAQSEPRQPSKKQNPLASPTGSYGSSRISAAAPMEEVLDFIKGKKAEGLIVTVTSMVDDKCLIVNDLQALDRGGGWTGADWIGVDFKNLWRDSFMPRRTNYFSRLIESIEQDGHIPEFHYQIRRPSGALGEYSSNYFLLDDFLGAPARVAVSQVGAWSIVEESPDGSEVVGQK